MRREGGREERRGKKEKTEVKERRAEERHISVQCHSGAASKPNQSIISPMFK